MRGAPKFSPGFKNPQKGHTPPTNNGGPRVLNLGYHRHRRQGGAFPFGPPFFPNNGGTGPVSSHGVSALPSPPFLAFAPFFFPKKIRGGCGGATPFRVKAPRDFFLSPVFLWGFLGPTGEGFSRRRMDRFFSSPEGKGSGRKPPHPNPGGSRGALLETVSPPKKSWGSAFFKFFEHAKTQNTFNAEITPGEKYLGGEKPKYGGFIILEQNPLFSGRDRGPFKVHGERPHDPSQGGPTRGAPILNPTAPWAMGKNFRPFCLFFPPPGGVDSGKKGVDPQNFFQNWEPFGEKLKLRFPQKGPQPNTINRGRRGSPPMSGDTGFLKEHPPVWGTPIHAGATPGGGSPLWIPQTGRGRRGKKRKGKQPPPPALGPFWGR